MIGFIGLGVMGRPMAKNLIREGFQLMLGGRHPEKLAGLGVPVASYERIGAECEFIILMATDGKATKEILFGEGGLAKTVRMGTIICDMCSAAPVDSIECARRLWELGVDYVDAPVSGGETGAVAGTLSIMAGGDREAFEKCRTIFKVLGSSAVYLGPSGSGSTAKLVNQMIVHNTLVTLGEAFTFAVRAGADPAMVYEAIRRGYAGSVLMDQKIPRILSRDFKAGGAMRIGLKDMRNAAATAESLSINIPVSRMTLEIMEATGRSEEDHSAIVKYFEDLNHTRICSEYTPAPVTGETDGGTVTRPWGAYRVTAAGTGWQTKMIRLNPMSSVSLQSHKQREERWTIVSGHGIVQLDDQKIEARPGDCFTVSAGTRHRATNTDRSADFIFSEVQLGDYLGEDDITRYQDDYGRE